MTTFTATVQFDFESHSLETAGSDLRRLQQLTRPAGFTLTSGQVAIPLGADTEMTPDREATQLSPLLAQLLREAHQLAQVRGHAIVGTEHVLLAMTRQSSDTLARRLLNEVGATEELRARLEDAIGA